MLYQAHKNCSKQATFWKLVIIQRNIKILSEGVMITDVISKYFELIEIFICEKIVGVIFVQTKWEEKSQRHFNIQYAFRCQILQLRDYRFQFNIKILSEGVMITNFISKSLEFIELLRCEKIVSTEILPKVLSITDLFLYPPQWISLYLELKKLFVSSIILHRHWKLISIWHKPCVLLQ